VGQRAQVLGVQMQAPLCRVDMLGHEDFQAWLQLATALGLSEYDR
jgi:hypothetical protein